MPAELERQRRRSRSWLPRPRWSSSGPHVGQRDARAALGEQQRGRDAAARRAHDRHVLSAHREAHRSFNVVRLKSAKMIATIRNRVMTFGSLQPISSKW